MTETTMSGSTRIACTIDLAGSGLQHGFLRLPHSTHESAYGWIPVPIACAANGAGPTVLLMAGNHGDEYEGQIALMKILRSLDPATVQGRIIMIPAANFPAVMAGRRVSPIDGGNLNRSFPGNPNGTPTEMIAHYIESVILPMCDCAFDLHSGGSSLEYVSHAHARRHVDEAVHARTLAMIEAFGAAYGGLVRPLQGEPRTMSAAAERNGVAYVNVELGGGGTVSHELVALAEAGIRRALVRLGVMVDGQVAELPATIKYFSIADAANYVYAMEDGLFEPCVDLRQEVEVGQPAGTIHFPATPWRAPAEVTFTQGGFVLCRRFPGWARRGDCLYQVATLVSSSA
jgi:predicted deacylase